MNPLHPFLPPIAFSDPRPKCLGVKVTEKAVVLTQYHHCFPRRFSLCLPRAQWEELLRMIAEGNTEFIHNCDARAVALHGLDVQPLPTAPLAPSTPTPNS